MHNDEIHNFLGSIDDLPTILQKNVIDEIVIAMPIKSNYNAIQKAITAAEEQGVVIRYAYQIFQTNLNSNCLSKNPLTDYSMANDIVCPSPIHTPQYVVKRFIDIVLSFLLLIFCSPLLIGVAILIKLTSKGPVFFSQDRLGFNKRIFKCYKFRTMVVGAERNQAALEAHNEMDGAAFKMKNDPRVTQFGRFLRRTSIDELPQLLNVLKGDISLVGPRPLPVRDYERFDRYWYCRRLSVLPGITCTWQISGRSDISFEKWMELDMEYIDHWSLLTDLKILLLTFVAVLKGRGAY
jgi:exopolysaccharide biosynthesis polyprenyl glycosylphosphotransferase